MNEKIQQFANWQLQWNVTFDTVPTGLDLEVDGVTQATPFSTWFNDSQFYPINAPSPQGAPPTRYVWSSWDDAGPQSHNVFVSDRSFFNATFRSEFWVTIDTNPTGLTISVDSTPYVTPYSFWCPDGANPWLDSNSPQYTGVLGERWLWREWSDGGAQSHPYTCTGPATVLANYTKQHSVNITTTPAPFQVIVDGQSVLAPKQYWWNDTSLHTLEALATQTVGPNDRFNFTGWSDFGARVHPYWANISDDTVTASYQLQRKITLQANFPGLSIDLDGSSVALPLVYWCDDATQHILDAPGIQTFGDTRYVYNSWSDGLGQMHMITCDIAQTLRVDYDQEHRVRVNSTQIGVGPAGFNVIIGGMTQSTPAGVWWPAGTTMTLDTDEFQPLLDPVPGTRYRFVDWDDSATKSRSEAINTPESYVANFIAQHRLSFIDDHASPSTTPTGYPEASGTYFDEGTSVAIQTDSIVVNTANSRWRFVRWDSVDTGGYSGTDNPGTVTILGPITQTVTWIDQYLLTLVSTYGVPAAAGWDDQESATEFWYDQGATATFWVEAEVIIATGEKAVFGSWTPANGTAINTPTTSTAAWTFAYLVTVVSEHGTLPDPNPQWIAEDGTYALTMEEYDPPTGGTTRYKFSGWTTPNAANGGYVGANRQATLPVTGQISGPITETATWTTEHLLQITSSSGSEDDLGDPRIIPPEEWVEDGTTVTVEVDPSVTIGDTKYTFKRWIGAVADPNSASTTIVVSGPVTLDVEWDSEPVFSIMDLWWLFVIIIIVVVVLVAVLLMRKKKPTEELPPAEEELPEEETPPAPE
jgi:hypothetical protein